MKNNNKQKGSLVLGLIFGLGILGIGIVATTMVFSTSTITNHTTASAGVRSLVTADAATREGIYRILDSVDEMTVDFTEADIPLLNSNNDAGVTVSGHWPILTVHGNAENSRTNRNVVAEIDLFPSAFAFDQAVYTHGKLDIAGAAMITGNIYATDEISCNNAAGGPNKGVFGNATTPQQTLTGGHCDSSVIKGDKTLNSNVILPPTIDISEYLTEGDYLYFDDTDEAANAIKNKTTSGTYHIVGDVQIQGNNNTTHFSGALIVDGDLTLRGGNYSAGSDNPLVIYVTGNLILGGGVTINGIVYVEGKTSTANGNAVINGSLLSINSGSDMGVSGNLEINYDLTYAELWQDILGLDTESGTAPKIKNWHEQ